MFKTSCKNFFWTQQNLVGHKKVLEKAWACPPWLRTWSCTLTGACCAPPCTSHREHVVCRGPQWRLALVPFHQECNKLEQLSGFQQSALELSRSQLLFPEPETSCEDYALEWLCMPVAMFIEYVPNNITSACFCGFVNRVADAAVVVFVT